jgi:hypothetical protein
MAAAAAHAVDLAFGADGLTVRLRHEFLAADETDLADPTLGLAAVRSAFARRRRLAIARGFFGLAVAFLLAFLAAAFEDAAALLAPFVSGPIVGGGHARGISDHRLWTAAPTPRSGLIYDFRDDFRRARSARLSPVSGRMKGIAGAAIP